MARRPRHTARRGTSRHGPGGPGLLLRRGVLSEPFAGRLRFHHQAIAYAAGRGLAEAPAGLEAAVGRIAEHAQDLYLAEVARHAFHHCDRAQTHRSSRWYALLAPLAKASSPVARETFVHILAGLRNAPTRALADIAPLIEEPDNGRLFAERYLKVLDATYEPAEGHLAPLLRTIWEAADGPGRREVLRTLTVRIRQQRSVAAAVLCALPAEELPRHALAPHLTVLMRHLHEEGAAAPSAPGSGRQQQGPWDRRDGQGGRRRTAVTLMNDMLDAALGQRGAPLEHALATLADLASEWPDAYGNICRDLPKRLAGVPGKVPKDMDRIIAKAAMCWAAAQAHERSAETFHALRTCLDELARGDLPVARHHVVLHGVATTLCHPGIRVAPSTLRGELEVAAASAPSDNTRKAIARSLLCPPLMAGDTTAGRTTRERCRARTTFDRARRAPQPPATALALTTLGVVGGQRLPAGVVAVSLPDDARSVTPRAATLDAEHLLALAATAESGPSARWRSLAWNPWRPYLRLLVGERAHLYELLIGYGPRDHQLARHLLEVAGQTMSNISEEPHRLLTDPTWPAELRDAARRTASWAGRDGADLSWESVYEDIE
ncbi:hypothetical protein OG468_38925 [Streptomyces zaomyceticus]|uniref:hypothetical protein n=1 Tax=Streptomyces zaomyceticus TaxID=68286 RepID=UPI00324AD5AA